MSLLFITPATSHNFVSLIVEMATLTRENGKTKIEILNASAVEEWIKKHQDDEAKADEAKKTSSKK